MLFNSYLFIVVFLPVTLLGCFLIASRWGPTAAQDWLIAASLIFYSSWNIAFLPLLLASTAFNFAVARRMLQVEDDARGRLLAVALAVDLGLLGYYKYAGYFVSSVDALSGAHWSIGAIALPLGISFYTFQQITLLVDASQGRIKSFRYRDFLLFVTFFPHVVAGPIVHHKEVMPQFERARYTFDPENVAVGFTLFAAGLFKKAVIADGIATQVASFFSQAASGQPLTLLDAWTAAIGFTLQIYFDFSGYSEMALGLARAVGIKLPVNFNSPLKAATIVEFWQRWNMTLTRFLTAYIFNPLTLRLTRSWLARGRRGVGGTRTTPAAFVVLLAVPILVTMFLSGLWHGAGNQFLVFGVLNGVYLVICHAWRLYRPTVWPDGPGYRRIMGPGGPALTFVAVAIAMLFFRSSSVAAALDIVGGMAGLHGVTLPEGVVRQAPRLAHALAEAGVRFQPGRLIDAFNLWIVIPLAIALAAPNVLEIMREAKPAITAPNPTRSGGRLHRLSEHLSWRPTAAWALLTAVIAVSDLLSLNKVTEFLYWQF